MGLFKEVKFEELSNEEKKICNAVIDCMNDAINKSEMRYGTSIRVPLPFFSADIEKVKKGVQCALCEFQKSWCITAVSSGLHEEIIYVEIAFIKYEDDKLPADMPRTRVPQSVQ